MLTYELKDIQVTKKFRLFVDIDEVDDFAILGEAEAAMEEFIRWRAMECGEWVIDKIEIHEILVHKVVLPLEDIEPIIEITEEKRQEGRK